MDRAAAVRLARPPLSVPQRFGVAAPLATAIPADLRARHQPRGLRVRRTPPCRPRRLVRTVRGDAQINSVLSRAVYALRLAADLGAGPLSRQHYHRRYR